MITKASITYGGSYKTHLSVRYQNGLSSRILCGTSCAMFVSRDIRKVTCKRCLTMAAQEAERQAQAQP